MITPSFGLTATERVLPRLALDFTTASLDSRITFTRSGNTATVTNSSGVIVGINANLPRFDFDPTTLVCRGLLIEETRINALLNSLIDGTSLTTQLVTVTAAARTLSFYGTGTVVLSGAHSATVVGTGAYPTRTTLTFTPSAGVLTLTVTGTVQFAQLETGPFATSFIPTAATTVTRNGDVAVMTSTNFSSWYNATEGTFSITGVRISSPTAGRFPYSLYLISTSGNDINVFQNGASSEQTLIRVSNIEQVKLNTDVVAANTQFTQVAAYKANNFAFSTNAFTVQTDNLGTVPSLNQLQIGSVGGAFQLNGWVQKLNYWPQRLINAEVQAFSK